MWSWFSELWGWSVATFLGMDSADGHGFVLSFPAVPVERGGLSDVTHMFLQMKFYWNTARIISHMFLTIERQF